MWKLISGSNKWILVMNIDIAGNLESEVRQPDQTNKQDLPAILSRSSIQESTLKTN